MDQQSGSIRKTFKYKLMPTPQQERVLETVAWRCRELYNEGSHRRRTAVALLKRTHQRVQRQRTDFHHKAALLLLQTYDTIYLEDLRVANMVRNRHLAKSISDAGWALFRTILACKAAYAGKQVVAVAPAFTSQDCSGCGERVPKSLSVRTHVCPNCGLVLDRDENAALNMLRAGQARQARTWADTSSVA
jgi:putative transposase